MDVIVITIVSFFCQPLGGAWACPEQAQAFTGHPHLFQMAAQCMCGCPLRHWVHMPCGTIYALLACKDQAWLFYPGLEYASQNSTRWYHIVCIPTGYCLRRCPYKPPGAIYCTLGLPRASLSPINPYGSTVAKFLMVHRS